MAALDHNNVSMKELHKSIGDLIEMEHTHSLDPDYAKELNDLFKKTIKDASDTTGKFLHSLHEKKPDKEVVKKMITAFPSSLSYRHASIGRVPVHSAVCYPDSLPYVLLLAKEGDKYNVGGDDGRGGLLVYSQEVDGETTGMNAMYDICSMSYNDDKGMACLDVIKELRRSNLILKEDIRDSELLSSSCDVSCEMIFYYLADWDPTALKEDIIIHNIIDDDKDEMENFPVFLKAALRHYPEELGLLFQKDCYEETACECAFKRYGKDKTFRAIGEFIPFDQTTIPILHHVVEKAPHLVDDFTIYYPSTIHLRDSLGRKFYQAKLACGNTTYMNSALFFAGLRDDEIAEIDPETDLYPFMVAASGDICDLSAVYYLLRRNPALVNTSRRNVRSRAGSKRKRGRKRKKDNVRMKRMNRRHRSAFF